MDTQNGHAAPESGTSNDELPIFEEADPEIEALLDFEPVPRKRDVEGGWTPELQRAFIARLARNGSPGRTCAEMGKNHTGIMKLYRSPYGASFRSAWDSAVSLAKEREAEKAAMQFLPPGTMPPALDHRRKSKAPPGPLPGQVMNELGEWEDEASYLQRAEEAKDSICNKLVRVRRLYLQEISHCPGKRAAFEILTELPIDWEKAERCEPQADEPYNRGNQRQPDMILTAESGWAAGEIGYGPDRKAQARAAIDKYREEEGLERVEWGED